jgi:hypothetical protein
MKYSVFVVALSALAACGNAPKAHAPDAEEPSAEAAAKELPELEARRVVTAMRGNEAELRKCFFRAPSEGGFVRVGFEVDQLGVPRAVAVRDSTIESDEVERCLTEQTSALRFGELAREGKAEWTYVFRLREPPSKDEDKKRAKKLALDKKRKKRLEETAEPGASLERGSPGNIDLDGVDQVIQTGYQLFAGCYRAGIERNVSLEGTIRFRFVIGEDGRMAEILDGESDLPDRRVLDCVAETFYALRFPEPQGGKARILYRLQLE